MAYFSNVNPELLERVPSGAGRVLEVGCGNGNFGRAYLALNPQCEYFGVEISRDAAAEASQALHRVIVGDIERPDALAMLDEALGGGLFDAIVLGEVLEHLRDPWRALADLRQRARVEAVCCACIPNVAHWSLLLQQLRGR